MVTDGKFVEKKRRLKESSTACIRNHGNRRLSQRRFNLL